MLTWGGPTATLSNGGKNMNYVILKSCFAAGEKRNAGDIVDLGPDEAATLSGYGRIAPAPATKQEPKVEAALKATNRAAKPTSTRAKK